MWTDFGALKGLRSTSYYTCWSKDLMSYRIMSISVGFAPCLPLLKAELKRSWVSYENRRFSEKSGKIRCSKRLWEGW